jgi:hypothetical protein
MPQGALNHANVNPLIGKTGGKRVAQPVGVTALGNAGLAAESLE